MNILLTVHQFFPKYCTGTEVLTLNMAKSLRAFGHQVRILTTDDCAFSAAKKEKSFFKDIYEGFLIYRIGHNPYSNRQIIRYEYDNPENKAIVEQILAAERPDIVHVFHCSKLSASILDAVKAHNIPVVFTATDFWFICPMIQLRLPENKTCSGPAALNDNCLRCFVNKTQNGFIKSVFNVAPSTLVRWLVYFCNKYSLADKAAKLSLVRELSFRNQYLRRQLNKFDKIFVPTEVMRRKLIEFGAKENKITKSAFGLKLYQKFDVALKKEALGFTFAFIGTISEHKGLHLLIEAFNKLADRYQAFKLNLHIYGNPGQFPEYTKKITGMIKPDDGRIVFKGTFPNEAIQDIFREIDVLVVPSVWLENTPLVIYSAFANKTPVICSDTEGMAEIVKHDFNGLIFKLGEAADLTHQMEKIVLDKNIIEKFKKNILPVKSIEEYAREMETVYYTLLER